MEFETAALPTRRALEETVADHVVRSGPDLLERWTSHYEWCRERERCGVLPYSRSTTSAIATEVEAVSTAGQRFAGVNFASQDYLSLATHPAVRGAAIRAAEAYGVHSAGSVALMGLTELATELERRIAGFVGMTEATVFTTGWAAGYGVVRTLARDTDHVILDVLAHACLQEGAAAATRNVHRRPHRSVEGLERRLARIRSGEPDAGILVVTESLFSMDATVPDLAEMQVLCRRFGATLVVDVAHDLGALGPDGLGALADQGVLGAVDVVMGSFSKTFASNGGFVASNHPALRYALRYN